jgi:hypothetical protein
MSSYYIVYDANGVRVLDTVYKDDAFKKRRKTRGYITDESGNLITAENGANRGQADEAREARPDPA